MQVIGFNWENRSAYPWAQNLNHGIVDGSCLAQNVHVTKLQKRNVVQSFLTQFWTFGWEDQWLQKVKENGPELLATLTYSPLHCCFSNVQRHSFSFLSSCRTTMSHGTYASLFSRIIWFSSAQTPIFFTCMYTPANGDVLIRSLRRRQAPYCFWRTQNRSCNPGRESAVN